MFAILFIITMAVCIPWAIADKRRAWRGGRYYSDAGSIIIGGILFSTFVGLFTQFILMEATSDRVKITTGLVSLEDNSGVKGNFFLGSGSVDSEPVFFYYTNDHGSYRLDHMDADAVTIRQGEGEPRLEQMCIDYNTAPAWISWPSTNPEGDEIECSDWEDQSTFYVPAHSIKSNYFLDAK